MELTAGVSLNVGENLKDVSASVPSLWTRGWGLNMTQLFSIHCPCGKEARSVTYHDNGETVHINHGPTYCDLPTDVFTELFREIVTPI